MPRRSPYTIELSDEERRILEVREQSRDGGAFEAERLEPGARLSRRHERLEDGQRLADRPRT